MGNNGTQTGCCQLWSAWERIANGEEADVALSYARWETALEKER